MKMLEFTWKHVGFTSGTFLGFHLQKNMVFDHDNFGFEWMI